MADIWLIGWQSIVNLLTTSADGWRIGAITLFRALLDTNKECYSAVWEVDLALYLIIGCLIIFIQSKAVEIGSSTEYMLLPFRPPLDEGCGDKMGNLPIGQKSHVYIKLQVFQPTIGESTVESSSELDFADKERKGGHLAESQLSGYY